MAEPAEELDLMIEEYLEGRMAPAERAQFEDRMKQDPELRNRVNSTTRSVELLEQALGWVTPGEDFDERVSSKIVNLTQSAQSLRPYHREGALNAEDPDARLLADPEAARERRRLFLIAIIAAVLFGIAAVAVITSIAQGIQKPPATERPR